MEWDGVVLEVWPDGDTFTADLRREGGPDVLAEFSMRECGITVERGDRLIVKKDSVAKRPPRLWTREELAAIMERAEKQAKRLSEMLGFPED